MNKTSNNELINSIKDLTAAVLVNSTLQAAQIRNAKADIPPEDYKDLVDYVRGMWHAARQKIVP